jgi:hypothetical protein
MIYWSSIKTHFKGIQGRCKKRKNTKMMDALQKPTDSPSV